MLRIARIDRRVRWHTLVMDTYWIDKSFWEQILLRNED
jgi:hypothetical protein